VRTVANGLKCSHILDGSIRRAGGRVRVATHLVAAAAQTSLWSDRYAEGKPERLAALANELAALKPDVIVAFGGDAAPVARTATNAIPIVMSVSNDPVPTGLVASLTKPGGSATGVTAIRSPGRREAGPTAAS